MSHELSFVGEAELPPAVDTPAVPQPFSPVQFLLGTYDLAIASCQKEDQRQAQSALLDLMLALELPHDRSATRLFHLFEFCLSRLRARDFQEAWEILEIIKDAWLNFSDFKTCPAGRA